MQPVWMKVGGAGGVFRRGEDLPEGFILQDGAQQEQDVPRRGIMVIVVQAGGIDKMGGRHADALSLPVHPFGKGGFGAVQRHGQHHRRLSAGGEHRPVEQVFYRYHLAGLETGFGRLIQGRKNVGGYGDFLFQRKMPDRQPHRHHLCHGGRVHPLVGGLLVDYLSVLHPIQQDVLAVNPARLKAARICGGGGRGRCCGCRGAVVVVVNVVVV